MDFLAYPFANLLLLLYSYLGNSTIVAIAMLTLLLNLITLPLTIQQYRSMRKTQELQPKIEKLQKKHAKDREKLSQEQMKLYSEAGINPLSGCLPLLIQIPIWFGLVGAIRYCIPSTPVSLFQFSQNIYYNLLPNVVGLVPLQSVFLGMDLGRPPSPAQWWSYSLPALVYLSSWLQQKLLSPAKPKDGEDKSQQGAAAQQMQTMQTMMPLMMMIFTLQYPIGLSIYFLINGLARVAQHFVIRRLQQGEEETGRPRKRKKATSS